MNDLCISTYVFGERYQSYIPLYIYSILKAYPNYMPLIICELPVNANVMKQLDLLRQIGNFEIRENCSPVSGLKGQRARAIRWIFDDDVLRGYESCYVGDIDILISHEAPSLFEQHMTHCDVLKLPYSNLVRCFEKKHSLKATLRESGLCGLIIASFNYRYTDRKLTGLHFYKVEEYLNRLKPMIPSFIERLKDRSFQGVWETKHHSACFNDENFLYDMMVESGMGIPPVVENYGPHLLDYRNYDHVGFRPHHGIHLGLFRGDKVSEANRKILMLDFYIEYYK